MSNHRFFVKDWQRILRIKLFINQYNWKETSFLSHVNDQKKYETNNKTILFNVLYVPDDRKIIEML